jgi:hypothetical protein
MLCSYGTEIVEIISVTEISPINKWDLDTRENVSSHYEQNVTFHINFI